MTWLEWKHIRWPLLMLTALGLALGGAYTARLLTGQPPFAHVHELGPWANSSTCMLYTGLLKHLESTCKVTTLFAGRWFDWWAPLLITLIGAYFGSRLSNGLTFLQLQPLTARHILGIRLASGVLSLSLAALLSGLIVSTRGALSFTWWSEAEIMRSQFWVATLLLWLRGLSVLLVTACLTQLLPASVAALIAIVSSLALLGLKFDPFVQKLTLVYTPEQFGPLAQRESIPLDLIQRFITTHAPLRLEPLQPVALWLGLGLTLAVLLALTAALFSRSRAT